MTDTAPAFGEATIDDCEREAIHIPGSIQPHAALLALHAGDVVHHSLNIHDVIGRDLGPPTGRRLDDLFGESVAELLRSLEGDEGRRRRTQRLEIDGREVDVTRSRADDIEFFEFESPSGSIDIEASFHDAITRAVMRLQSATSSQSVIDELCHVIRDLTGFDRVMGYRFEPDDHGIVVSEERRADLEPFHGLHYPASDIPAQARAMYLAHWIRSIPDVGYEPVPIQPVLTPHSGEPLDLSGVDGRSVSPIHCEYLTNMGVRSSMSISIVVDNRLWGLIACHHYDGPRRLAVPIREACEFVALSGSVVLASRLAEERVATDLGSESTLARLAEQLVVSDDLAEGLTADPSQLLGLVGADGAALYVGGVATAIGTSPSESVLQQLAEEMSVSHPGETMSSSRASELSDTLASSPEDIAGLIALPLSSLHRNYLFWFRKEWRHEVRWGGEPGKAIAVREGGSTRLAPRASFDEWVESVTGTSQPWTPGELRAVEKLRSLIANHVTRTVEQLARLNSELSRSNAELDAFAYVAAHDLKEPLRGMANYAAFLAEDYADVLDDEGREQLAMMSKLSDRMTGLLTSLLDYARVGRSDLRRETLPLRDVFDDTIDLLRGRIADSGAEVVLVDDGMVDADPDLLSHVLLNLVSNGIKYNENDVPTVEVGTTTLSTVASGINAVRSSVLADIDTPVIYVRDNGIGIEAELTSEVFRVFRRLHQTEEYGGGSGAGLTIARRIVERHGGSIWLESTPGEGTTFYFTLGGT